LTMTESGAGPEAAAVIRYKGTVKIFKGSFGFLTCPEVAEQFGGRDTFVHKNDLNTVPDLGSTVAFRLIKDAKGNPKAVEAVVEGPSKAETSKPSKAFFSADGKPVVRRAAMMLFRGDEVLVVREKKEGQLLWSDLGGKVEEGEDFLACALRELAEEAEGFLSAASITLLKTGAQQRFGAAAATPEIVNLKKSGPKAQAVAIFPMDCEGVDLELLPRDAPNAWGVHEMKWLHKSSQVLRDRQQTRWPLLRTVCALLAPAEAAAASSAQDDDEATGEAVGEAQATAPRERSRSRSPRRSGGGGGGEEQNTISNA